MLCLYVQAPFAACRTFTAGWYRPTATFVTPSAAYGLILNVAGIESRLYEHEPDHDGSAPATLLRHGLPAVRIALGIPDVGELAASLPTVQTIYQQLHNYPVGKDAGISPELAKGNKNNITPVRRELLCNLRSYICLDGNTDLEDRVRRGLRGAFNATRYGVPFLGDNQLLLDRLDEVPDKSRLPAYWFERLEGKHQAMARPHTARLTVWIDRADMSRTVSYLYAPRDTATCDVPEAAWTTVEPK